MTTAKEVLLRDPVLRPLVEKIELQEVQPFYPPFTSLLHAIIGQQLSSKAASSIIHRFKEQILHPCEAQNILMISEQKLRKIGLSTRKASYCHNIARHRINNPDFWHRMEHCSDQQIIDELTKIKGVGEWTVHMLLIFNLQREDVFPIGDLAIRDVISKIYNVDISTRKDWSKLEAIARRWSPHRSLAVRYLWAYRDGLL